MPDTTPVSADSTKTTTDGPVLSTLANGLHVLESLAAGRTNVRHLSEELHMPRQTVYRILRTMTALGWVEVDRGDDTYCLTSKVWSVASRSFRLSDVRDSLSPVVRHLAEVHGESVHLATYENGEVTYIDKAEGWHPIRSYTELGGTAPAHCVATGKMLLALQPQTEVDRIIGAGLEAHTSTTITDGDDLGRQLGEARRDGYAINRGEWREGVAGIALPIVTGPAGDHVAIGFSGPEDRILARFDDLLAALRESVQSSPFMQHSTPIGKDAR